MSFFCSANIGILGNSLGLLTRAIYDTTQEATIGDLSITPAYESRKDAQKDYCAAISVCSFPNKHLSNAARLFARFTMQYALAQESLATGNMYMQLSLFSFFPTLMNSTFFVLFFLIFFLGYSAIIIN